jgi:hypothetical protein
MAERAWTWDQSTPRVPVGGWSQGAVMRAGEGRVAVFGEAAMFTAQLRGPDRVPMGMNAPYAAGNHKFLLNVSHWLSGLLASNSSNPSPISIPTAGRATPYPATANVSGLSGSITDVNVTLHGVRHTWPDDLSILLVGPGKRKVMLMSDVGGAYWLNGLELTLDDEAPGKLPDSTQITAGRYLPTQGTVSGGSTASPASLPSPAPAGPYGTSLSAFKGADANGNYSVYVFDDATGDMGQIAAGFSLDIRTTANPG